MKNIRFILSSSFLCLSATVFAQNSLISVSGPADSADSADLLVEKAALNHNAPTKTTLSISNETLGLPVTVNATIRTFAAAGSPQGAVYLLDKNTVIAQFPVAPTNSPNPKFAYSAGSYTFTNEAGSAAYSLGRHRLRGLFFSTTTYRPSSAAAGFLVSPPVYTVLSNGVSIATLIAGTGDVPTNGQHVAVLYTGYLGQNRKIFDYSDLHAGTPLDWNLGGPRVVPGFNDGVSGMLMGETRAIVIPPELAYGKNGIPSQIRGQPPVIPPNSTLVFLVQMVPPPPLPGP
jgi:hypothetical protein